MSKTKTLDEFKKEVSDLVGNEYEVIGSTYINNKTKILMKHNTCGKEYDVKPNKFLIGRRCPFCQHKSIRKTTDEFKKEVFNLVGDEYEVLGEYKTNETKIEFLHKKCGKTYMATPTTFLKGHRCPHCYGSIKKTFDIVKKELEDLVGDEYTLISCGLSNEPITVKHNTCGKEFSVYYGNFFHYGSRCPDCRDYCSSKDEKELINYIKSVYNKEIKTHFKLSSKRGEKEIDVYLPDLKLGIEFDGLYWHSTEKTKLGKYNLLEKTKYFNDNGIRIIHIFEDEWKYHRDIVKDKILNLLHLNIKKIYARKCIAKIIESKEANEFLNKYHLQGCGSSTYKVGLFYNDELVAVMSFVKSRMVVGQKTNVELFRYATSKNVIGGFSKLLKFAIGTYNFGEITTFADLRWSDPNDNVYIKNGFKLDHISEPSYWYFTNSKRFHRSAFMKYKLKDKFPDIYDEKLTEKEIMKKAGYKIIYDCGTAVFKYDPLL